MKRLPWSARALALRALLVGASWRGVAAVMRCQRMPAQALVNGLHDLGAVHVARWESPDGDGRKLAPVFVLGPGVDVAPPPGARLRPRSRVVPVEVRVLVRALRALDADELNRNGLADAVGISKGSAASVLAALKAERLIYVSDYMTRRDGGAGAALYSWGPGLPDKVKPKPLTPEQLWARHNARRAARLAESRLLSGMVRGHTGDRRTAAFKAANATALEQRA